MTRQRLAGRTKPRNFFDRKVISYGYSRSLSLGKIIPKTWRYVRIRIRHSDENAIVLEIVKLLGNEVNAQTTQTNKRRQ